MAPSSRARRASRDRGRSLGEAARPSIEAPARSRPSSPSTRRPQRSWWSAAAVGRRRGGAFREHPLVGLRFLGGAFFVAVVLAAVIRYRRRAISRLNLLLPAVVTAVVVMLGLPPNLFKPVFDLFRFKA